MEGNYSLTDLYNQAIEYANTNVHSTQVYIIINKGPYISFGLYSHDFHITNNNKFSNKYNLFDGCIGLETDENFNVKVVPQFDTINLQHKLYKLSHDAENKNQLVASSAILKYTYLNNPDVSKLNWGDGKYTDSHGGIR